MWHLTRADRWARAERHRKQRRERRAQKREKKRNKKDEATPLQGGTKTMPGDAPKFVNDGLKKELEKMHMTLELELQPTAQKPPGIGHKNSGRQVLPDTTPTNQDTEKKMDHTTTEGSKTHAPAAPSPEDRVVARLDAIALRLERPATWKTGVAIGGAAVIGVGVVTLGTFAGMRLANRGSAAAKPRGA
jgi:hypothetical protein